VPSPNHHILFVCTGNTGRSVAAAALARHLIVTRGLALMVGSRGVAVDLTNTRPKRLWSICSRHAASTSRRIARRG